jgi:hypothetical protein
MRVVMYEGGHPDTPPTDWGKFRKGFSPYLIGEVLGPEDAKLPDWFVPLARGAV